MMAAGIVIVSGWRERLVAFAASISLVVLIALVATNEPGSLTDP